MAAHETPSKPSPWNPAIRSYVDRTAQYQISARNWQIFGWGCLLVAALAMALAISLAGQPRLVPYVVSYNAENEQIKSLGLAQQLSLDQQAQIVITQYELRQFIQNWRMVVPASDFQALAITDYVKPLVAPNTPAGQLVAQFYQQNNPYKRATTELVDVNVDQPLPQTPTTYSLHWVEQNKRTDGSPVVNTEWNGLATVSYTRPNAIDARLNPAGITITNLSVQQISSTPQTPPPTQ